jgi:hypothetical protein
MKWHPARQSAGTRCTLCLQQFSRGVELDSYRLMDFRIFEAREIPKDHMICMQKSPVFMHITARLACGPVNRARQ